MSSSSSSTAVVPRGRLRGTSRAGLLRASVATAGLLAAFSAVSPALLKSAGGVLRGIAAGGCAQSFVGAAAAGQRVRKLLHVARPAGEIGDVPAVQLNDGSMMPLMGYGTYKVGFVPASASSAAAGSEDSGATQRTASECVLDALKVGYRFLDCAQFYGNEAEVGKAIKESGVPREDLYLESKVWTDNIYAGPAAVRAQLEKTLQDLGTDYVDLYCIHWPVPGKHIEAYLEMEKLREEGKIRSLGVSNYAVEDYKELMETATVAPVINQIEINPFLYRRNTISFFEGQGLKMQSYRALRDGKAFDHPAIVEIAKKLSRTPAQVLGRWCVQHGFVYIPKSVRKGRMLENSKVFDFELSSGDMLALDSLTTPEAIDAFEGLYKKCVNRDTPLAGSMDGVKTEITAD
eukprot:TRINITY_DN2730_c1_g1_i3.p1 TRINITY_DN2730_c1_g1~~TRINITY_DN2730_c1_g1_i3.p1  ORF type:complete len:404 (-),score=87.02 TRINITY_DN2730_c1_g1_i3:47-1258(-)